MQLAYTAIDGQYKRHRDWSRQTNSDTQDQDCSACSSSWDIATIRWKIFSCASTQRSSSLCQRCLIEGGNQHPQLCRGPTPRQTSDVKGNPVPNGPRWGRQQTDISCWPSPTHLPNCRRKKLPCLLLRSRDTTHPCAKRDRHIRRCVRQNDTQQSNQAMPWTLSLLAGQRSHVLWLGAEPSRCGWSEMLGKRAATSTRTAHPWHEEFCPGTLSVRLRWCLACLRAGCDRLSTQRLCDNSLKWQPNGSVFPNGIQCGNEVTTHVGLRPVGDVEEECFVLDQLTLHVF